MKGQVMLLTVVILTSTILATTAIAGFLTLLQLKQAGGASDSMRAIFAADTGLEWELYKHFKDPAYPQPTMDNGASFRITPTTGGVKSTGYSDGRQKIARAFEVIF